MNFPYQKLTSLTQEQLQDWMHQAQNQAKGGRLPTYISKLAIAKAEWFAACIQTAMGDTHSIGNTHLTFSLMSVVKPFVLLYLLETVGPDAVFSTVGMLPSDQAFNAIPQLQKDQGFPRNPMLNSGAIALVSMLPGHDGASRCEALRQWLNRKAGCQLRLDTIMLGAVRSLPNEQNRALAEILAQARHLSSSVADAIDAYEQVCCLAGNVAALAQLGQLLIQPRPDLQRRHQQTVTALMTTCGMYEQSGRFAAEVGIPAKSGVSGAILAAVPGFGAIACYSPPLDAIGNSAGGVYFLKQAAQALALSIF